MNRRNFLKTTTLAATLAMPALTAKAAVGATPAAPFAPSPEAGWRTFELTSHIEPQLTDGVLRAWVPLPSVDAAEWFRPMGNLWQGNASVMRVETDPVYGASMLYAEWAPDTAKPQLEVVSRFATRDRAIDFSRPAASPVELSAAEFDLYTRATELLPTDGIVRDTALEITRGASTDEDKARAIYEWVVDNTFRNPKTRGCGVGDIRTMLETRDLSGKCADLNTLYVGLARAVGLPSRDVLRRARGRLAFRLQEPGQEWRCVEGAALPRRSLSVALWLGAGRSRRRAQGRARRAAGQARARRRQGGRGAQAVVWCVGDQLAGL